MSISKKLLTLALVTLMAVSTAACSSNTPEDTPATQAPAAQNAPAPESDTAEPEATEAAPAPEAADGKLMPTPAGEYPIVPEGTDVTLTIAVMQTPMIADYETNYLTKWIEERSGVKLDYIVLPADTLMEKVLLTLSTNDINTLPDVYFARGHLGPDTIFMPSYAGRWYDEGMIIPLNDLIDNWGDHSLKAFEVAKGYGYSIREWMTSADGNT
jgi:putative aldouronate transport system substrate-binding protein